MNFVSFPKYIIDQFMRSNNLTKSDLIYDSVVNEFEEWLNDYIIAMVKSKDYILENGINIFSKDCVHIGTSKYDNVDVSSMNADTIGSIINTAMCISDEVGSIVESESEEDPEEEEIIDNYGEDLDNILDYLFILKQQLAAFLPECESRFISPYSISNKTDVRLRHFNGKLILNENKLCVVNRDKKIVTIPDDLYKYYYFQNPFDDKDIELFKHIQNSDASGVVINIFGNVDETDKDIKDELFYKLSDNLEKCDFGETNSYVYQDDVHYCNVLVTDLDKKQKTRERKYFKNFR